MRKLLIVVVLAFSIVPIFAQMSSVKVGSSPDVLGQNGLFYSLPRTVLQIDVVVTKMIDVPGPYASYASQVLGLSDYVNRAETSYELKGIHISSFSEADPKAVYFLNFGERSSKSDRSFIVQLQANGVLKGMNETTPESEKSRLNKMELRADYFEKDFQYYADLVQGVRIDTIIRRISIDTTSIEDIVYNRTLVEKTNLERAQDAANVYMEIHKNRVELLSGFQEVNYPAQTIALMNSELKAMETDYLALFKGKRFLEEETYSFYIVPEGDKTKQTYPVFKFSKEQGLGDLTASAGERVNLVLETNGLTEALKSQVGKVQTLGVFYRIPESARVWTEYNNTILSKDTFILSQLGVIQAVSTDKTLFAIDANTGMLKAMEIK